MLRFCSSVGFRCLKISVKPNRCFKPVRRPLWRSLRQNGFPRWPSLDLFVSLLETLGAPPALLICSIWPTSLWPFWLPQLPFELLQRVSRQPSVSLYNIFLLALIFVFFFKWRYLVCELRQGSQEKIKRLVEEQLGVNKLAFLQVSSHVVEVKQ